jgi:hypothetical protein
MTSEPEEVAREQEQPGFWRRAWCSSLAWCNT